MLYTTEKITHEYINRHVSDYDIICYYLGGKFTIGATFSSPFREDKNPSFGILKNNEGALVYHDFATSESGNTITFVKNKLNLNHYNDALERVYRDLVFNKGNIPTGVIKGQREAVKGLKKEIAVRRQYIRNVDKEYWGQFGIDRDTLNLFEVDPIKYLIINGNIRHVYEDDNPMYVYKVYDKLKIYRPLANKSEKWYGSLTKNYVFGHKQLPDKGELVIITKSLKDVMLLHTLGYNAISPSSETTLLPVKCIEEITDRFKKIVVLYDNDEAGRIAANRMNKKFGLNSIEISEQYEAKDLTDFYLKYGKDDTLSLLKKMLG